MEKTEYKGSWWLPEKPSATITGSLRFESNGRITLELLGALTDTYASRSQSVPLILGHSIEGETITLYGCIQSDTSYGIEGVRTSSFYIVGVLIGAHFQRPEEIVFGRFAVTFPQLEDWVGTSGVSVDPSDRQTLVITKKSSFVATAGVRDAKISIGFWFTEHHGKGEVSVKYIPYISIEMTREVQLRTFLDLLYHLRNFFAFAVCHPVYPELIDGFTEVVKVTLSDGKSFCCPIKIVYSGVNWGVSHDSVNRRGMLFELGSVRGQLESLLKNWFDKIELLEPVYDMYFGTLYNSHMFLQQKFLSLIQGVESYHRRVFDGYESPPEQHKKRLQDIIKVVPDEYKNWLQNQLSDSNELSLKKRLEELVRTYSFLGFDAESVEKLKNARNYLTHFDENKKQYARADELFTLTRKLRALTESILLTELGLPRAEVEAIMKRIESLRAAEFHMYDF